MKLVSIALFLCLALSGCGSEYKNAWTTINKKGETVTGIKAESFSDGLAAVNNNGKWGFIDHTGKVIIPYQYRYASYFSDGLALVTDFNGQALFIDKQGKIQITLPKGLSTFHFKEGLSSVTDQRNYNKESGSQRKYGFMDKKGKMVIPFIYDVSSDSYYPYYQFSEGLAPFMKDGLLGFINQKGKIIIKPQFYGVEGPGFSNGLALVQLKSDSSGNKNYVFIDHMGKTVIQPGTELIFSFSEGLAAIKPNISGWGYINTKGKMVIPPQFAWAHDFSDGLAAVSIKDKAQPSVGYINKSGKIVIPPKYWDASEFQNGIAQVCLDDRYLQCSSP